MVIEDIKCEGDIHFKFDLRKGQCLVKLGQRGQVFEIKIAFKNRPILSIQLSFGTKK